MPKRQKQKHRQFSDDFKARALARLADGSESIHAVAKSCDVGYAVIAGWLKKAQRANGLDAGVRTGPKGRKVFGTDFKLSVVARVNAGEDPTKVADELGIRRELVYKWKAGRGLGETGQGNRKVGVDEVVAPPQMQAALPAPAQNPARLFVGGVDNEKWDYVLDAFLYLKNAMREVERMKRTGEIKRADDAHLLTDLALRQLEKATGRKG